jgi:hypothetical protein
MPKGYPKNGIGGRFKKGFKPWNKGMKMPEEHLKKLRVPRKGAGIYVRKPENQTGKYKRTLKHREIISKNHHDVSGKNNPMYGKKHKEETRKKISIANGSKKGWITPFTKALRKCFKYRQWRSDVFTRDNWTCVVCFIRGTYLEADHYPKMFSSILQEYNIKDMETADSCEELWNINNGRTLCKECHNKTKLGKPKK